MLSPVTRIKSAKRAGSSSPRELSVVGYDDSPLATRLWPSLTSVRRQTRDTGRILVGRCAVTTLTPGAERRDLDPEKSLLHRVRRMVFPLEGRDLP